MKAVKRILALACVSLLMGISIAYYNTSSLGYDDANIICFNSEELQIFDININYKKVNDGFDKLKDKMPSECFTI